MMEWLDPTMLVALTTGTTFLTGLLTKANASVQLKQIIALVCIVVGTVGYYVANAFPEQWEVILIHLGIIWLGAKASYEVVDVFLHKTFGIRLNELLLGNVGLNDTPPEPAPLDADEIANRLQADMESQIEGTRNAPQDG